MFALLMGLVLAAPTPVVAIGDGLVAGNPARNDPDKPSVQGGWVAVLADCLDERAPGTWTVMDATSDGETAASARLKVREVRQRKPKLVIVGVGARELANPEADLDAFRAEVSALVSELRVDPAPLTVLVGLVPPTLAQVDGRDDQAAMDARVVAWNEVIGKLATARRGVQHVDLWTSWPSAPPARALLTEGGWYLSDQGHALVAAAVCDAVVSAKH